MTHIPEEAKSEIIKRRLSGWSWIEIADWMQQEYQHEAHRTTYQKWYEREVLQAGVSNEPEAEDIPSDFSPEAHIKLIKNVEKYKGEKNYWKKLAETSLRKEAKRELLIDAIKKFTPSYKQVQRYKIRKPTAKVRGRSAQVVVAPLTDTHVGDNVEADEMVGLNAYNIDIFNKRLYGWATQLLKLIEFRRSYAEINELVIPMLGDMISGDIHEELARTNNDHNMGQMIRGANLIAQALIFLAPHFKKIRVPCVVGNHGRMTRKPPMKNKYMDWDYMLYQWISVFCKNQKNIEFHIPKSFMTTVKVCNRNLLLSHGDFINGAGSGTAISKGINNMRNVLQFRKGLQEEIGNLRNEYAALPDYFDSVLIGHFHRIDEIDIGTGAIHICGCMKGGDEFAMQRVQAINKPRQLVLYYHPKYGEIGKDIIYLNRYDATSQNFNDVLPQVWVPN